MLEENLVKTLRDITHVFRFLHESKGGQKRILVIIDEEGVITQRRLTEILQIKPGSVSEQIAKLEAASLLIRTANATDKRTCDISLTEIGKAAAKAAKAELQKSQEEMFACLEDDERKQLLDLLTKVKADWDKKYYESLENEADKPRRFGMRQGNGIFRDREIPPYIPQMKLEESRVQEDEIQED